MSPDQIIATLIVLMSQETEPAFDPLKAGGHDDRYPVLIEACPRPLGPLEVEGATVICGRIDVPEDHAATGGATIPLAFAVLKSRSTAPAPDPVIYLHGGLGGHTVQDIPMNAALFDFLRDRRDIILFDQRGAGLSDRTVACYTEFAEEFVQFVNVDEDNVFAADGPMAKCLTETVATGINLSLYNTTQSAHDVRAIMDTLGYPTYNAFGISYGTKLAQELMRTAPDGLRSVVIDSISRVDSPAYDTNGVPMDQALGWVVDFCMQDDACAAAYPDLEETVQAAGRRLTEEPKLSVAGEEIDAEMMSEIIDASNAVAGPFTAYLPQVFTELAAGETATLEKLITGGLDPDRSAAAIMAQYGTGLGDLDKTLAEVALMEADQMRSAGDAAAKLLSTLSNDLATYGALNTEALLDEALSDVATRLDADTLLAFLRDYTLFIGKDPDRSAIETLIATHIPDVDRPRLLAMVAAMTEEDVAAFYQRARVDAANLTALARMIFALGIIACQEDFPFNTLEGYNAVAADYRFPSIDAGVRASTAPLYGFCELFEKHPRDGFHEPVTSDIPTLAMSGTKDTQTNPDAAEKVVRTLTNGQAVLFPEAGHAVIMFSQCAKDVAEGFVETPSAPVNAACTADLKPKFFVPPQAQ